MTKQATCVQNTTEKSLTEALIQAKGDLFVAAGYLGVTVRTLNGLMRHSASAQNCFIELKRVAVDPEFERLTGKQFEEAIRERMLAYKIDGLDALHELATMPIDPDNSGNNQVKMQAAARLAGPADSFGGSGEMGEALRELNEAYHSSAPRIRITRQTMVQVEVRQSQDAHPLQEVLVVSEQ